ncbi:hypothetical protein [Methylobacterium sp. WSM2598]|uniref:hypothetical protein n=1 Tax=Methylobacterium sp. WSM2598 TaxID=398261 RepID=UPI00037FF982|nr:hypothetical protein [Methylobacterium sp. WSM2598]
MSAVPRSDPAVLRLIEGDEAAPDAEDPAGEFCHPLPRLTEAGHGAGPRRGVRRSLAVAAGVLVLALLSVGSVTALIAVRGGLPVRGEPSSGPDAPAPRAHRGAPTPSAPPAPDLRAAVEVLRDELRRTGGEPSQAASPPASAAVTVPTVATVAAIPPAVPAVAADPARAASEARGPVVEVASADIVPAALIPAAAPVPPRAAGGELTPQGAALLARARGAVKLGDIAAARRLLEHAAADNHPLVLEALAETYDPSRLSAWRVKGVKADVARALTLYRSAASAGSASAAARLTSLERADGGAAQR